MNVIVLRENGQIETHLVTGDADARLARLHELLEGYPERVSPAFHALDRWTVYVNDNGLDVLPLNVRGSVTIGMNLNTCNPLSGPIVLVELEGERTNAEDRLHETAWFSEHGLMPEVA